MSYTLMPVTADETTLIIKLLTAGDSVKIVGDKTNAAETQIRKIRENMPIRPTARRTKRNKCIPRGGNR